VGRQAPRRGGDRPRHSEGLRRVPRARGQPERHCDAVRFRLRVNKRNRFLVGDFRRRQPGTASAADVEQTAENVIRSFDGKASSAWWTTPTHSLAFSHRKYWEGHEVGHLFDIKNHLGYVRKYDKRAQGIWVGTVWGKSLFASSAVFLHGVDGRRSLVVDDVAYDEAEATPRAKIIEVSIPERKPEVKTPAKTKAPAKPRPRTRNGTGRTKRS